MHNCGVRKSDLEQSEVETDSTGPISAASLGELISVFNSLQYVINSPDTLPTKTRAMVRVGGGRTLFEGPVLCSVREDL